MKGRPDTVTIRLVTTVSPMKRGLKVDISNTDFDSLTQVTTVSPMKRGLKADHLRQQHEKHYCYNRFPDEKGTERPCRTCRAILRARLQPFPR